jgi:hypothetical protein
MILKFPNYTDSLSVEECLKILQNNQIELDITVKDDPTCPTLEIKKVEHDMWEKVRDLLGGSGEYNSKRMKGVVFNLGRYFSPIKTLREMEANRKKYLEQLSEKEKSP